ncbi:ABC transporter ATP-binding protein [Lactiplantibacillus pentosus]
MAYIDVRQMSRMFLTGTQVTHANTDISFKVEQGSVVVILGPSGAGKSTLLNILGGMDSPSEGEVLIDGVDIAKMNARQLTTYRRQSVGFVFQFYNLVPNLTARENVELASQITKNARDVAKNPKLLLCDEPTGALDYKTGKQVLQVIQNAAKETETTVIIVTHNSAIAKMGDQVIRINDAHVQSIEHNAHPTPLAEIEW